MMSFMEPDATNPELGHQGDPVHHQGAPVHPVHPAPAALSDGATNPADNDECTSASPAGALRPSAPVHEEGRPGAPVVHADSDTGAPAGASLVHRSWGKLVQRTKRTSITAAPVQPAPVQPVTPPAPAPPAAAPVRTTSAPAPAPRRKVVRPTAPASPTLGQQWGKLTEERSPAMALGLRILAGLIVISLVGVVIAPPALSAHDIIEWAQSKSTHSGLGLDKGWAWVTFLALDFAAGVCVLICVYCAIVNIKPGIFALYVWAFAGATAYANWSFGDRPNAPGDAQWFFPAMSVVGPLLLHSVLKFLRNRLKGAAGNKRGQRPSFPLVDWMPIFGTPQDTYGAWRTGAMLGIEVPDAALWTYRVVSKDAGWWGRWLVKKLVRTEQISALNAWLNDPTVALAIPGLLPQGAFTSLVQTADAPAELAPAAPVHSAPPAGAPRLVHGAPGAAAPVSAPPGAPVAPAADAAPATVAPVPQGAPVALGHTAPPQGAPAEKSNVVNLDAAAHHSALTALEKIYANFADPSRHHNWDDLIADKSVSLAKIERDLNMGKRRTTKAFAHAEQVLPWAKASGIQADGEKAV